MRADIAQACLQFMSRVQLSAQEIPAFQGCIAALQEEAKQPSEVTQEVNEDGDSQQHQHSAGGI